MSVTARRALAVLAVLAFAVIIVLLIRRPWSTPVDPGDPQAFCNQLEEGVGLTDAEVNASEFEALSLTAPPEIRVVVNQLRNSARDLTEIANDDPINLAELFSARFDPEALDARERLEAYAVEVCGIDLEAGVPIPVEELQSQLRSYLDTNHSTAPWIDKIDVRPVVENGQLDSILGRFLRPAANDELREVCEALSVYLYAVRGASGFVDVADNNNQATLRRAGPGAICV